MSDAIAAITMPKWGLAMTEGLVTEWHIAPGDTVERGQEAVDIETEKITNVFESPVGGVLHRRLVEVGETVPVGALLGVVAPADTAPGDIDAFIEQFNAGFSAELAEREQDAPQPESVAFDDLRLRYLSLGEGGEAPLLLLHGFGGDLNNWLFNQPALAEARRVLALDLPGHGGSQKQLSGADVPALAAAVEAFLAHLDLPRVHLAGHSLGGAIAAQVALVNPARVRSLSLLASAGLGPDIDIDYIRGFIAAQRRKDLKPLVSRLFEDPALVSRDMLDDILKFKRLDGVTQALGEIAEAVFPGGVQARVLRDDLAGLGIPVQVIFGAGDRIIPPAHAEGLAGNVAVHVLEGAGHMVHMEKAAEVNALLGALLDD